MESPITGPATAAPAANGTMPPPATITDAELFAALLPSVPCEHPDHGTESPFHADGNPFYVRFIADCGHYNTESIAVACFQWLATLRGCYCSECDIVRSPDDVIQVIGPVASFTQ